MEPSRQTVSEPEQVIVPETCHTSDERRAMYAAIPDHLKAPALAVLAEIPADVEQDIKTAFTKNPDHWWRTPDFRLWGMAVRNLLRSRGFDSDHFHIHNLDDIYISLVEDALKLR